MAPLSENEAVRARGTASPAESQTTGAAGAPEHSPGAAARNAGGSREANEARPAGLPPRPFLAAGTPEASGATPQPGPGQARQPANPAALAGQARAGAPAKATRHAPGVEAKSARPAPAETVLIDTRPSWMRRPRDLVSATFALLGIALVMLAAIYAQNTTVAVTSDAASATSGLLGTVLFVPFTVIEGLISFFLPLIIVGDLIWRRRWRALVTAGAAVAVSILASSVLLWVFTKYFPASPITGELAESLEGASSLSLLPYVSVLSALLAVSGGHKQSRVVSWGWPLLFFVVILSVLQGSQTLPGAVITVLIGLMFGELARYLIGADPERALGTDIVRLARRAAIDAREIIRVDPDVPLADLRAWRISTSTELGYGDLAGRETLRAVLESRVGGPKLDGISDEQITEILETPGEDIVSLAHGVHPVRRAVVLRRKHHPPLGQKAARNYVLVDAYGTAYHGAVIDADEQIVGVLATIWDRIRFETATRRAERSIEETAEHMALMELAARQTGDLRHSGNARAVRVASGENSCMVVTPISGAMPLSDDRHEAVTDAALDDFWTQLDTAHRRGITHGNINAACTCISNGRLELACWESGSIASSDIARRIDMAQAVAMLATVVGAERAVASARRRLSPDIVISMAPMLQRAILPGSTVAAFGSKKALQALRDMLVGSFGEDVEVRPIQLHRFSAKTVFTVVIGLVAVYLLLGSINFAELKATVSHAKPLWLVVAFAASMVTYLGAGMMLKNFTAEKISLRESAFVQLAASVVSLVAPAGIGHAALNLRYLQKRKVATPIAVATVSLVQVFQFGTTVLFLLALALITGDVGQLSVPSSSILVALGLVVAAIVAVFAIAPVRRWVVEQARPYAEQVWPRLVWLGTHPERIVWGVASALVLTFGYVLTFAASLFAFDYSLPIVTLAITYLVSNSVGSVVPSPGGIGPVEAALTGGLTLAGVPYSIAFSTAIVYRLLTFWAPVPIGWVCLQYLQKKDIV